MTDDVLKFCQETNNFSFYNLNDVILDYARGYLYAPKYMSLAERGHRFQGLSPSKFSRSINNSKDFCDDTVIHKFNDVIYVPSHKNFYHMIIDCLPRLYGAKTDSRPVVICKTFLDNLPTIFPVVQKWFPDTKWHFLEAVGDKVHGLSAHTLPGRIIGNNIGFYSNTAANLNFAHNNNKILAILFWQKWYKENYDQQSKNRKIFIYRESGDSGERLYNQEEICNVLKTYDFEIINPTRYSFEEIAKIMNGASIIVGAHGAGLANAIFCQPNITYIQLANSSGSDKIFQNMAKMCQANYHVIFGTNPTTGAPVTCNRHGLYSIDISTLTSLIV